MHGVYLDAQKQAARLSRGWCTYAAVLVVADDEQFDQRYDPSTRTLKLYSRRSHELA